MIQYEKRFLLFRAGGLSPSGAGKRMGKEQQMEPSEQISDQQISRLAQWLSEARKAVFFGGAGTSTESGIPDFRSADGIFRQNRVLSPEEIVSHDYFTRHPREFYDFYRSKMVYPDAGPNAAHRALARLEREGHLAAVVTQNIDGLHQAAGSRTVFELHGSIHRNFCTECGRSAPLSAILSAEDLPRCPSCGGLLKPDVVLYGEALDEQVICKAVEAISRADLLIIGGTSLSVYPAAGFIRYFRGRHAVIINKSATPSDDICDLQIHASIGKVLKAACERMDKGADQ